MVRPAAMTAGGQRVGMRQSALTGIWRWRRWPWLCRYWRGWTGIRGCGSAGRRSRARRCAGGVPRPGRAGANRRSAASGRARLGAGRCWRRDGPVQAWPRLAGGRAPAGVHPRALYDSAERGLGSISGELRWAIGCLPAWPGRTGGTTAMAAWDVVAGQVVHLRPEAAVQPRWPAVLPRPWPRPGEPRQMSPGWPYSVLSRAGHAGPHQLDRGAGRGPACGPDADDRPRYRQRQVRDVVTPAHCRRALARRRPGHPDRLRRRVRRDTGWPGCWRTCPSPGARPAARRTRRRCDQLARAAAPRPVSWAGPASTAGSWRLADPADLAGPQPVTHPARRPQPVRAGRDQRAWAPGAASPGSPTAAALPRPWTATCRSSRLVR